MGAKRTETTSSQTRNPWDPAQPLLNRTLGGMNAWLDSPGAFQTYGGPMVAQMSGQTQAGLDRLGQQGDSKSSKYLNDVLDGRYLDSGNPATGAMQSRIMADVMPGVNMVFGKSGMSGSTLHQGALMRGLTDGMAPSVFQNYENERGRQTQAAGMLNGMDRQGAMDQIWGGQLREGYDQRNIDGDRRKWEEQRMAGLRPYQEMWPMLSGMAGMGGTQTGTQTTQENTPAWQTAMSLGMMGLGAMSGMPGGFGGMGQGMGGSGFPGMGNYMMGAPWGYGSSWTPWTNPGSQ